MTLVRLDFACKGLVGSAGYRYVLTPLGNRLRLHLQEAQA